MKRVGIITLFYNSLNYGGLLQAYALCNVIEKMGYSVEQVRYDASAGYSLGHKVKDLLKKLECAFFNIRNFHEEKLMKKGIEERKKKIMTFSEKYIPYSSKLYTPKTFHEVNSEYEIFVAGSDQIWTKYSPVYTLEYISKDKRKISYAASIGRQEFDDETKKLFKKSLESFDNISVREKEAVKIIQECSEQNVAWVLDPTMLLKCEDWDEICTDRIIDSKYLFCYFLGDDIRIRKLAKFYSEEHGLKIVCLPHLHSKLEKSDIGFGDYQLYDISPADFVSLVKYAEIVFTDSFHASVFSGIYKKEFIVFNRISAKSMSTRINSLCELYQCEEHFCDTEEKFSLEYINNLKRINYECESEQLIGLREISKVFLQCSFK